MDEIDLMIPTHIKDILSDLFSVLGTLFVVCYAMPIVIAIVIPMIALFLFIQSSYLATSRHGGLSNFKLRFFRGGGCGRTHPHMKLEHYDTFPSLICNGICQKKGVITKIQTLWPYF